MFGKDATDQALERLQGAVCSYHVPDKATVELHIRANRERALKCAEHAPITARNLHADCDKLLERWWYLHLIEQDTPAP